jgi:hypothetical protein
MSYHSAIEEGNGNVSFISKFNGKDFPIWKKKMLAYLSLKGLAQVVTSEEKFEKISDDIKNKANNAYAMLLLSLTNEQARLVLDVATGDAAGLWKSLSQIYECKTTLSLVYTRRLLYNCKMKKTESFDSYLAGLKDLISRLEDMKEKISNSEAIFILLNGLPSDYSSIVSAMEINDKITFNIACENIRNYQEKLKLAEQSDMAKALGGTAMLTGKITCFTCGEEGHKSYKCIRNKDKKKCENCRKIGHSTDECKSKPSTNVGSKARSVQL